MFISVQREWVPCCCSRRRKWASSPLYTQPERQLIAHLWREKEKGRRGKNQQQHHKCNNQDQFMPGHTPHPHPKMVNNTKKLFIYPWNYGTGYQPFGGLWWNTLVRFATICWQVWPEKNSTIVSANVLSLIDEQEECHETIWITLCLCLAQTHEVVSFMHKHISDFTVFRHSLSLAFWNSWLVLLKNKLILQLLSIYQRTKEHWHTKRWRASGQKGIRVPFTTVGVFWTFLFYSCDCCVDSSWNLEHNFQKTSQKLQVLHLILSEVCN